MEDIKNVNTDALLQYMQEEVSSKWMKFSKILKK